jgi:hypothetical protein
MGLKRTETPLGREIDPDPLSQTIPDLSGVLAVDG